MSSVLLVARLLFAVGVVLLSLVPAWWLARRLEERATPFFQLLLAGGIAGVGYLTVVGILGRVLRQSTIPATLHLVACAAAAAWLWSRRRDELDVGSIWRSRREWTGTLLLAALLALPQFILAVSTPYWDEVASSAIHVTGANQFAEGIFPPRHNALPQIAAKYHYAFIILSGTVHWLTGLSANVSIDVASTALWFFTFLFIVHWLRSLGLSRGLGRWAATTAMLGGGLAWVFMRRVEAYDGFAILPASEAVVHRYAEPLGVAGNLVGAGRVPSLYLRNPDGSLSSLPWDIAAQLQQHAVSLGIALGVFALWAFVAWQRREDRRALRFAVTALTFGLLFLAHAVFGGVAAVACGLVLLGAWIRRPTWRRLLNGAAFGAAIAVVALLHGGLLAFGAQYGASADVLTLRHTFGYSRGGVPGFVLWNLAGFGIPLLLACAAWIGWPRIAKRHPSPEARLAYVVLTVFTVFSYLLPHLAFYSSESIGVEQFTEISKFFFTAHLGFALLSAWGAMLLAPRARPWVLIPSGLAMAVTPLAFVWVNSTTNARAGSVWRRPWLGPYFSPYRRGSIEQQMGEALATLKRTNHDTYFDASADERAHGFLSEMLIFGGSVFTLTPSRYERTGVGYRLSQQVVAERFMQNGRMAMLRPGAAEACECRWYYARPEQDMAFAPVFVRARFDALLSDSTFRPRLRGGQRVLYEITGPTTAVDRALERHWRPRAVTQAPMDWDGDRRPDLVFYDFRDNLLITGRRSIALPERLRGDVAQVWTARFGADSGVMLLGRAMDTRFLLGRRIEDVVEESNWGWTAVRRSGSASAEVERWRWTDEVPVVAPLGATAIEVAYAPANGRWYEPPWRPITGPFMPKSDLPVPLAGRFIRGSRGDLVLRSRTNGQWSIQSLTSAVHMDFRWGLGPNEVLVPGDWDGDGYDELGIWNETNLFWYWRRAPDGPITQFQFGRPGAVPLPFDYNGDGRLDAAYWVPAEGKIYVTFSAGRSVDRVIAVPPHALPVFVNVF